MSQWLYIKDLIKKTSARCPENTPFHSKDLMRLHFIPENPYTRSALSFTPRLQVQDYEGIYVMHILMTITALRCLNILKAET